MRLDGMTPPLGRGKFALIKLRELTRPRDITSQTKISAALALLAEEGILDYGDGLDAFFVMRLRDKWAAPALDRYALECCIEDPEFSNDINGLADRAYAHPQRRTPD